MLKPRLRMEDAKTAKDAMELIDQALKRPWRIRERYI